MAPHRSHPSAALPPCQAPAGAGGRAGRGLRARCCSPSLAGNLLCPFLFYLGCSWGCWCMPACPEFAAWPLLGGLLCVCAGAAAWFPRFLAGPRVNVKVDFAPKQDSVFLLVAIVFILRCSCAKNLCDGERNTHHDVKGLTYLQPVSTVPQLPAAQHPSLAGYRPYCSIYHRRFLTRAYI